MTLSFNPQVKRASALPFQRNCSFLTEKGEHETLGNNLRSPSQTGNVKAACRPTLMGVTPHCSPNAGGIDPWQKIKLHPQAQRYALGGCELQVVE